MVFARPADTLTRSSTNIPALYKLFIGLGKSGDPGCLETLAEHDKGSYMVTVVGDQFVNSPRVDSTPGIRLQIQNTNKQTRKYPVFLSLHHATYTFTCHSWRSRAAEFPEH